MSATIKGVDVLAVIDARIAALGKPENEHPNSPRATTRAELHEARAAVAELIDKVDSALTLGWSDTAARELRAALARAQGGAK